MDLHGFDLNLLVALDALLSERSVTNAGRPRAPQLSTYVRFDASTSRRMFTIAASSRNPLLSITSLSPDQAAVIDGPIDDLSAPESVRRPPAPPGPAGAAATLTPIKVADHVWFLNGNTFFEFDDHLTMVEATMNAGAVVARGADHRARLRDERTEPADQAA